ncbi:homoserine dehydrogenase [Brachyspira hyodysenteriae]|uniref:Homoserine dehydrogenase n=1 Tax=Brachyspira hyodysenteriae (strain ATCC 49526 / WA1) TaxID=565034 RepID=A0A3B6VF57_BRAHW|nr:homoserine dehydrogenase [Brachyspira hyodysenteriae]ACN82858.1 homoserine dehydrogenase [Brachyspira hyodysenteriae WA1]KLI17590.1 homoserine dehydrogenase [Brachyspira hyodysenteriae]KLI21730.1 homoserine dehydrogenase [Brachyspira hyodysenteriae]KLI37804.1 homoserine dehydrogenase [Brachyspira hyodysenteriae]KLI41608.1 homoserine dehydrogenase [Brachyspira hyodysenteriae]
MDKKKEFKVAVAGYGHVGKDTVKTIIENNSIMEKRTGIKLTIKTIFSRNIDKVKDDKFLDKVEIKTKDLNDILNDDDIDIVIEVLGGMDTAKELLMKTKKPVVTANKALLANCFGELIKDRKTDIAFEASVAGAIPIIKAMKESLVSDRMENVYGILNGTCNYILTNMTKNNLDFKDVLKDAQDKGYAEADPTFDIDGIDTAHKLCILSSIAFCNVISFDKIFIRGIRNIILDDIVFASEMGLTIKLIAEAALDENNNAYIYVIPTLLNDDNMLSKVDYAFNAITVVGDRSGDTVFYGSGAGGRPTSSAIVSDAVTLARNSLITDELRIPILGFVEENRALKVKDFKDKNETFYVRFKSNNNNLLAFNEAFYDINIEKSMERNGNFMFVLKNVNINSIIESIEKVEKIDDIFIAKIK